MIYAIVEVVLLLSYGVWRVMINQKYEWFLFQITGYAMALLVPQPEFKSESNIRFIMINFTVFVLLILHGINFSFKCIERAVLGTVTTFW